MTTLAVFLTLAAYSAQAKLDDLAAFFANDLTAYQDRLDKAAKEYQEEQWLVETADPKASTPRMSEKFTVLQKVTYDQKVLTRAREVLRDSTKTHPLYPKLERALKILEATILVDPDVVRLEKENQDRQDKLVEKSNAFRLNVAGETEGISKALYGKRLASTKDRKEREQLWRKHNSARAGKWLEWGFRDLLKSRNEEAKAAGFYNFYDYRFSRNQLDLGNYRGLVEQVKSKLSPKAQSAIKAMAKGYGIATVAPWDLRFLREESSSGEINEWLKDLPEKTAMDIARDFYEGLGIKVDDYGFTQDLYPRPGKNTHAFAMSVVLPRVDPAGKVLSDPKMDIRFLANLKKPVKWGDVSTIIHELGHAIHAAEVRQPIAYFRGIGSVDTEAFAMTTERMAGSNEFFETVLPKHLGISVSKMRPALKRLIKAQAIEQALVLMRQAYFSDFEYQLYANPDADFGALWAKLHQEWWGIEVVPSEADWDVEHFLMAPIYVQNYALGIVMVEQLYETIRKEFKTSFKSKALGTKIRGVLFAPGMEHDYLTLVKHFTGKPLTATAALKLLD